MQTHLLFLSYLSYFFSAVAIIAAIAVVIRISRSDAAFAAVRINISDNELIEENKVLNRRYAALIEYIAGYNFSGSVSEIWFTSCFLKYINDLYVKKLPLHNFGQDIFGQDMTEAERAVPYTS